MLKYFSRRAIFIALCLATNLFCAYLIAHISKLSPDINFGSFSIPAVSIKGILTSVQSLTCILMVFISYKIGIIIASLLSASTLFHTLLPIIKFHSLSSLPGIFTTLLSVITFLIIYSFYKKATVNSLTDYTTGLQNRRSYVKKVSERLTVNKAFGVACIEIEDFKQINNMFGMQGGDFVLHQVARRLMVVLEKGDVLFTITGPTFAILFDNAHSAEEIESKLEDFICRQTVTFNSEKCTISLAAGICFVSPGESCKKNASKLLHDAETALLSARKTDDKKIFIFDNEMENAEENQKQAEFLIRESLENNYFYLVYQPQFTTNHKELRGFEALIRCKKPDGSIVNPGFFIPAAEKTNLIMKIDDYVLKHAMVEFKPILDCMKKNCILSINVSAKNIGNENFSTKVKNLLDETGFPPRNLEIEITEYSFADSMKTTVRNILALREIGVQVALDDFGTGYTSIAQLMKLPVNLLKIDKSLIDDIETNQTMRDMVDSVIYMGHIMNCEVISEGVENEKQLAMLREHHCDFIQGFVWGKPQPFSDAEQLCRGQSSAQVFPG